MGLVNNKGHGALGIRARMRDFVSLIDTSETEKTVIVELQPVQEISEWAPDQDGAFISAVDFSFDGVRRDIIDVRSLIDPTLKRVETVEACRAEERTFFYDPELLIIAGDAKWDDGDTEWDDGTSRWDQFTQLLVHLTGNVDPDETTIVAVHSFGFAPKGMVQPQFGPLKLLNGDFEDFTGGEADFWENFEGSGFLEWDDGSLTWDDGSSEWDGLLQAVFEATNPFNVREGESALGMVVAAGGIVSVRQNLTDEFTPGKIYRFYGAYKTQGDVTAQIVISNDLDTPGNSIFEDGRSVDPSTNHLIDLQGTGGEYRRFSIDFLAFDTTHEFLLRAVSGGGAGEVFWDDVDVRRIWSYKYFEPRVQMSAIPETRSGTHDVFFGRKNVGVGSVRLVNANGGDFDRGYFYELVPKLEWMNQNCIVRWGGEFPPLAPGDESQEILLEDFENAFTGLIQSQNLSDEQYEMGLQDLRSFFHASIPIQLYDIGLFAQMDPQLQGNVRPLLFGRKNNINPPRIQLSLIGNYGNYEIADVTDAPNGIFSVDTVFAYEDQEAATSLDAARRITLTEDIDYIVDLDEGNIAVINDVGPFVVTVENNIIEWQDGPLPIVETFLPTGLFTATQLAAVIELAMEGTTGNDYSVTYDQLTHEFTISRLSGAGTFNLATNFGDDKDIAIWPLIGFDKNSNKTGGGPYTSDEPVFTDVDQQHVIRVNAQGFKDDSPGSFTGAGTSLINKGADILQVIIRNYMKKSVDLIDQDSFEDARTGAPEELAAYFGEPTSTKDIFDALEFSNAASITVNADGIVFYKTNIENVTSPPPLVDDKDIEEHVEEFEVADVYQTIRIAFDQDPTSEEFLAVEATDDSVVPRLGRPDTRTFETFLKNRTDAVTRANFFLDLANTPPRKIVLNLLGGRFIRFDIGDKIDLTIDRATGVDGQIQNKIMRIVSIRKRPQDGKVNMEVTDNTPV